MTRFQIIHNLVNKETGKTFKEENLELKHNIPVGTLVEVEYDEHFTEDTYQEVTAKLWVVKHYRDCDGTPLYSLGRYRFVGDRVSGFPEYMLKPVG